MTTGKTFGLSYSYFFYTSFCILWQHRCVAIRLSAEYMAAV